MHLSFGLSTDLLLEFHRKYNQESTPVSRSRQTKLLASNPDISPINSGVDLKEDKKRNIVAKASIPLSGGDAYLPAGVGVCFDSKKCSYQPSDDLNLDNFERRGGHAVWESLTPTEWDRRFTGPEFGSMIREKLGRRGRQGSGNGNHEARLDNFDDVIAAYENVREETSSDLLQIVSGLSQDQSSGFASKFVLSLGQLTR